MHNPPITEVACGLVFEKGIELDPFLMGVYWDAVLKERYPNRDLRHAITNSRPNIRGWFLDENNQWLIQLESSRFYLNWRKVGESEYPRFGKLSERFWDEYEQLKAHFAAYVEDGEPNPFEHVRSLELTKINNILLPQNGAYFDCSNYLASLGQLPIGDLSKMTHFALEADIESEFGKVITRITTGWHNNQPVLVLEFRDLVSLAHGEGIKESFTKANNKLNNVFVSMLTEAAKQRFGHFGEGGNDARE